MDVAGVPFYGNNTGDFIYQKRQRKEDKIMEYQVW